MGIETSILIAVAMAGAATTSSIMEGHAANREAKNAANLERLNSDIARREVREQSRIRSEEMTKLKETQKLAMIKSGMGSAGSPLLILEDTKRQLSLELDSLEYKSNIESYASSLKQQNYLASGRSAMINGYVKGFGSLASSGVSANG